jgi:hypothetical protein
MIRARCAVAAALAFAGAAFAQAPAKPTVYALVSAIGNEISYVRQVKSTGTNITPYRRYPIKVPDGSVDAAVLRGLDRAVAQEDPDSKRIFLRLEPGKLTGIYGVNRGETISKRIMDDLANAADRKDWDRIILVIPRFVNTGSSYMGDKLHGIGIYVQPLGRGMDALDTAGDEGTIMSSSDPTTFAPDGTASNSYRFSAPYFFAQIWVIDARTMKVLEKNERFDFVRYYDPDGPIDPSQNIPTTILAEKLVTFVERASSKAFREAVGEVVVKEPKIVNPSTR